MKPLGQRQLFGMKRETLEARLIENYKHGKDSAYAIQCALIILIRNALSPANFSFLAKELICSLFLESNDLQEVKELCVYFRPYFTDDQWKKVTTRLFPSRKERSKIIEQARLYTEKLSLLHSGEREAQTKASLLSTFLDENGKKHSWTLSNVDPTLTSKQHEDYLSLLSTLTILQKDGVRRFVSLVEVNYSLFRTSVTRRTQEEIDEQQAKVDALPRVTTIRQGASQSVEGTVTGKQSEETAHTQKTDRSTHADPEKSDSQTLLDQSSEKNASSTTSTSTKTDSSEELNAPENLTAFLNQLKRKAAGNPLTKEERKLRNRVNKALGKNKKRRR